MFGGLKTTLPGQSQPSLFGNTSGQSQMTTPLQPLQPQAQIQQQIPSGFNSINPNTQQVQEPSRFEKYQLNNSLEPYLFENDDISQLNKTANSKQSSIKKRVIPAHLIKRINKVNDNSNEEDKPSAPILPFKASTQVQPDTFNEDFAYLYEHDKPPTKSLFDPSIFNDDSVSNEMLTSDSSFNKMNENPLLFNNVFQRPNRNLLNDKLNNINSNTKSDLELPWSEHVINDSLKPHPKTSLTLNSQSSSFQKYDKSIENLYCSVIIYGFNDEHFRTLIKHFAKYGKIMEKFIISDGNYYYGSLGNVLAHDKLYDIDDLDQSQNLKSNISSNQHSNKNNHKNTNNSNNIKSNLKNSKSFPIFLGQGWVKVTYDNPNSAIRALSDNLTDDGNGNILGVIPYRREDLEILLRQKINDDLNIGEGLNGLSHELELEKKLVDNDIGRYLSNSRTENLNGNNGNSSNSDDKRFRSSSLIIKDGSKLLMKNNIERDTKAIWHKGISYFFGNGDI